jgi:hypothetical protein
VTNAKYLLYSQTAPFVAPRVLVKLIPVADERLNKFRIFPFLFSSSAVSIFTTLFPVSGPQIKKKKYQYWFSPAFSLSPLNQYTGVFFYFCFGVPFFTILNLMFLLFAPLLFLFSHFLPFSSHFPPFSSFSYPVWGPPRPSLLFPLLFSFVFSFLLLFFTTFSPVSRPPTSRGPGDIVPLRPPPS